MARARTAVGEGIYGSFLNITARIRHLSNDFEGFVAGTVDPSKLIPSYPRHDESEWDRCRTERDFVPIMFDWYRWIGNCCTVVAFIQPNSLEFRQTPKLDYYLLSALLSRCSRLMLSIVALIHKGQFAEAAQIIHRSLSESAVKVMWLCQAETSGRCRRLIADGLRPELEFQQIIQGNVLAAGGVASELEERMLRSMQACFEAADMTPSDVASAKRLPDMAAIVESLGWPRLQYVVQQRLGSHAVHGTWPCLLTDYLTKSDLDGYEFTPDGNTSAPHINILMAGGRSVIQATAAYVEYFLTADVAASFVEMLQEAHDLMMSDYQAAIGLLEE